MLVHVDLGVELDGYCSDLQRTWYVLRNGESTPPDEIEKAFDALRTSLEAGFEALRPGVPGHSVDAAARRVLMEAGYDEPEFALGHQLGRSTHDAGALLGPRWARYGSRPDGLIEAGNVFTLEFAVATPAGSIGLEEDVLVTGDGAEYLSRPQMGLICLRG
jgi:Xaa-Pro aminopeptidase